MKKVKREIKKTKFVFALFVLIVLLIFSFSIGNYVSYKRTQQIDIAQKAIYAIYNLSLIEKDIEICNYSWEDIWKEKVEIGSIITQLESSFGKNNPRINEQKKIYNQVQINTLDKVIKINEFCGQNLHIIIYFYTNDKSRVKEYRESEIQGSVLDTLYNLNPEKIRVFSFDMDIDEPKTKEILEKYDIEKAPSIVINNIKWEGIIDRNEIQRLLNNN